MLPCCVMYFCSLSSHPARGAWIEMLMTSAFPRTVYESHPARGAWIEIFNHFFICKLASVAPRKGRVD